MKEYNENIVRLVELTQQMVDLADMGDHSREDISCGVMYGVLRDTGYRLMKLATDEIDTHRQSGVWDPDAEKLLQKNKKI